CERVDVVVADNGSADGSADWVEREYPEVKVIKFPENYGFAEGYNRAIEQCKPYRFITLLNSDVEVTEGWWQPLVAYLEDNPDCGAVQPKIRSYRDKKMFEYAGAAGGYLDALGYPYCRGRLFDSVEEDKGQYDGPAVDVAWASGACLTIPREVYIKAGGLDPKFFAHMEEIDLCCRVWRLGLRVAAISDSKVYHVGGASLHQGNPKKTYLNFRNNLLLLHKNLPEARGRRLLFMRRLADTLAWAMYMVKGDFPNANAIIKAHRDFKKMRREYTPASGRDVLAELPGAKRYAVIARHLLRRKSLKP
ncbi:MAG: glycosyltransferase family 2 protein, partial [Muribaculaceae bacterium]|nr:glycosyltransferase family 2 protein [Muribaculaceae bacterium]